VLAVRIVAALPRLVDRSGNLSLRRLAIVMSDQDSRRSDQHGVWSLHFGGIQLHLRDEARLCRIVREHGNEFDAILEIWIELQQLHACGDIGLNRRIAGQANEDQLFVLK